MPIQEKTDLHLFGGMAMLLHGCQDETQLVEVAEQYLPHLFPHSAGALFFLEGREPFVPELAWGDGRLLAHELHAGECHALDNQLPHAAGLLNPEARTCAHIHAHGEYASLCVPLSAGSGPLGLLTVVTPASPELPQDILDKKTGLGIAISESLALAFSNIRLRRLLCDQAIKDPLTGLFNRRHLREVMGEALKTARRKDSPLSLVLLDIDHFKRFNDTYGHDIGDEVLVAVAATLKSDIRAGCTAYRFGGEELMLLVPDTPHDQALKLAERLRLDIAGLRLESQGTTLPRITVSMGVATWPEDGDGHDPLVKSADTRLYVSKESGRNQVTGRGA